MKFKNYISFLILSLTVSLANASNGFACIHKLRAIGSNTVIADFSWGSDDGKTQNADLVTIHFDSPSTAKTQINAAIQAEAEKEYGAAFSQFVVLP